MPNRKTGLDVSVFTAVGSAYIGDLVNFNVRQTNKTAEGKGIADIDDWPVLTGAAWEMTGELAVLLVPPMMGTANSNNPAGTLYLSTGSQNYAGTIVLTSVEHRGEREGIQTVSFTALGRGHLNLT